MAHLTRLHWFLGPLPDQQGRILKWYGTVVGLHDWKLAQEGLPKDS